MVDVIGQNAPYFVRQAHFDNSRMAGSVPAWKNNSSQAIEGTEKSAALSLAGVENTQTVQPPSLSFSEMVDVVNPLHHLPVVGSLYRGLTGDDISPVARIAGGTLYGGPLGGLSSLAHAAIEEHSGQSTADALRSGIATTDLKYAIENEQRMAGNNQNQADEKPIALGDIMWNEPPVSVAMASPIVESESAAAQKSNDRDISWDKFEKEERKPVTRLFIDMAEAPSPQKQQWNLNA
jgi:hypothetical protein